MNTSTRCIRPRGVFLFLLLPLLLMLGHGRTVAQTGDELDKIAGLTYVIAYPDTTQNTYDERFKVKQIADTIAMFIYSPVATKVRITGNGYNNVVQVQAKRFAEVYLNGSSNKAAAPIVTQSNIESRNVFRLEADDPVVVYCYICTKFGAAAWTPLAVESWGLEYYAAANEQEILQDVAPGGETDYKAKNKAAPAEACVISAYDNTTVTIVPSLRQQKDNFPDWNGFPNLTVTLQQDRAYQVQGYLDTLTAHYGDVQPDIAGVYIYADKPIGVVSGNTRGQLNPYENAGLARNSFKDLMIEQMAPIDQHGKQFVFAPTMDDRVLTGQPGEATAEKRTGEIVRVYGTSLGTSVGYSDYSATDSVRFTFENASTYDFRVGSPSARFYRTDTPAQAYKSCLSVVKNLAATGGSGSYDSWGTYMVEMVPREQWVTFAPFIAPVHPGAMKHYVDIVTDTGSRFKIFDENNSVVSGWINIPGTDLCWTYRGVTPGITKFFKSTDTSARFYAFAYGLLKGHEEYRPGKTKKKDDARGVAHPSEYEEYIAATYGYPVAPSRVVLRPADSLVITKTQDCDSMIIEIQGLNVPKPVGFRKISLDPTSVNTRLTFLDPIRASDVIGKSYAKLKVTAIDKLQNASGKIIIVDRTGKKTVIDYSYEAERVDISPASIVNYGEVTQNTSVDSTITITNPLSRPVSVLDISMFFRGAQPFVIIEPTPLPTANNPLILQPGEKVSIKIRFTPTQENTLYVDTLMVKLGCASVKLPVRGETVKPCVYVGDLNFGTFVLGENGPKTLPLEICNRGRGFIKFNTIPGADSVVAWLIKNFSVPRSTLDSLRDKVVLGPLGSGTECFTIYVTFTPTVTGIFETWARFRTTTDCLRDSSQWRANVVKPGPQITGYDWRERWLVANPCPEPNSKNPERRYVDTIYAFNTGNSDFEVQEIRLVGPDADAGVFSFDHSDRRFSIRPGDIIAAATAADTQRYRQIVVFQPNAERIFHCEVQLITTRGDTARSFLDGIGIESHVEVTNFDADTTLFQGAGVADITGLITVSSKGTRPLTVYNVIPEVPGDFIIDPPASGYPFTLAPNQTQDLTVHFRPQTPGQINTRVLVIGDHSFCDAEDSTNTLVGYTYTLNATATGYTFGAPLTCDDDTGQITLTNTSQDPVVLTGVTLTPGFASYFELIDPTNPSGPDTIPGNTTRTYRVRFFPSTVGTFTESVTFIVENLAQDTVIANPVAIVTGQGRERLILFSQRDDYRGFPGQKFVVPVEMQVQGGDIAEGKVSQMQVNLRWDDKVMTLDNPNEITNGTVLQNWTPSSVTVQPNSYDATFTAPPGVYLTGQNGILLNPRYTTNLESRGSTRIYGSVFTFRSCVKTETDSGTVTLDTVCGMQFRLIELVSGKRFNLAPPSPNPVNESTTIDFEIGLDGPTKLVIYDANGQPVLQPVTDYLQPGRYSVTLDTRSLQSGLYFYALYSGDSYRMQTMVVNK